jgi:hypothetical protein
LRNQGARGGNIDNVIASADRGEYRQAAGVADGNLVRQILDLNQSSPINTDVFDLAAGLDELAFFRFAYRRSLGRANLRPGLSNFH